MAEDKAHRYFVGIMEGVRHIHASGYCHRDIKLENILLTGEVVKICDFGFATAHTGPDGNPILMSRQCGSLVYASPQAYHGESYEGCKSDVWSCGVVLYVMLCGEFPFGGPDAKHCRRFKLHQEGASIFPELLSQPGGRDNMELLRGMLQIEPKVRSTVHEVLRHPWSRLGVADTPALAPGMGAPGPLGSSGKLDRRRKGSASEGCASM